MKISAIIRIICWSLVAVILTGLMVSVMVFNTSWNWFSFSSDGWYREEVLTGDYSAQHTYTIDTSISNIEVNWRFGQVTVIKDSNVSSIQLIDFAQRSLNEDEKLQYSTSGGTLKVQYCKEYAGFPFFKKVASKHLELRIPTQTTKLSTIKVTTVSAGIHTNGITANSLNFGNVSGGIKAENVSADTWAVDTISGQVTVTGSTAASMKMKTVSGDIKLGGQFQSIRSESVSGELNVQDVLCPKTFNAHSVSGDVSLGIPDNDGFTIDFDKVSGDLSCDFPTTEQNNKRVYKDGSAAFDIDTVSGDFTVQKAGQA